MLPFYAALDFLNAMLSFSITDQVGSIEGRVGVHHLDDSQQSKNFTFKCHREGNDIYSVNALNFHPVRSSAAIRRSLFLIREDIFKILMIVHFQSKTRSIFTNTILGAISTKCSFS